MCFVISITSSCLPQLPNESIARWFLSAAVFTSSQSPGASIAPQFARPPQQWILTPSHFHSVTWLAALLRKGFQAKLVAKCRAFSHPWFARWVMVLRSCAKMRFPPCFGRSRGVVVSVYIVCSRSVTLPNTLRQLTGLGRITRYFIAQLA